MARLGVALGGGGLVGVAWERGLVEGLLAEGVDLRRADVIVGTSAGSLIGSQLAAGLDFSSMAPEPILSEPPTAEGGVDLEAAAGVMEAWSAMDPVSQEGCARIGRLALRARTAPEAAWVAATGGALDFEDWPDFDLRISVVDAETGEPRLFDRHSGVPIEKAVAASCAVPGLFPTLEIGAAQYMDGGVWSGTHADALLDDPPDQVVVIAPLVEGVVVFGRQMDQMLEKECEALSKVGSQVVSILPEAPDREAFGPNMMDGERAASVLAFARERGRSIAKSGELDAFR